MFHFYLLLLSYQCYVSLFHLFILFCFRHMTRWRSQLRSSAARCYGQGAVGNFHNFPWLRQPSPHFQLPHVFFNGFCKQITQSGTCSYRQTLSFEFTIKLENRRFQKHFTYLHICMLWAIHFMFLQTNNTICYMLIPQNFKFLINTEKL